MRGTGALAALLLARAALARLGGSLLGSLLLLGAALLLLGELAGGRRQLGVAAGIGPRGALGCGLGFFLAMVLFSGVRSRVAEAEPPKSFEGLPITLVSAAIVSLSFFGLTGIIDRLFG